MYICKYIHIYTCICIYIYNQCAAVMRGLKPELVCASPTSTLPLKPQTLYPTHTGAPQS